MNSEHLPDSTESDLPPEIQAALKRQFRPPSGVPESVDRQVLAKAEQHLTSAFSEKTTIGKKYAFAVHRWSRWVAGGVAVAVLLLAGLPLLISPDDANRNFASDDSSTRPQFASRSEASHLSVREFAPLPHDFDQNGQVNILDAYALAVKLEQAAAPEFDANSDGRTDVADAEWIAMNVVTL